MALSRPAAPLGVAQTTPRTLTAYDGIRPQIHALRLCYSAADIYALFNDLAPAAQKAARDQFEDAQGFDGWLYRLDREGHIIDRVRGPFPPGVTPAAPSRE